MTYIEKLFDAMDFISKRHCNAAWIDTNGKYDFHAKLDFFKRQEKDTKNDYEWVLFSFEGQGTIELRLDLKSLAFDLHLPEPDIINGFPSVGLNNNGVMFKIPEEWKNEYENKEYIQEDYEFPIPFWRCSDEMFEQRVNRFNATISRMLKKE